MRALAIATILVTGCLSTPPVDPGGGAGGGAADAAPGAADAAVVGGEDDAAPVPTVDAPPPPDYPDETVTGWRPLPPHATMTGDQTITVPGTTLENVEVDGCLTIDAANVTVTNAFVHCGGDRVVQITARGTGARIEDVTIDGERAAGTGLRIGGDGATVRRVDLSGARQGLFFVSRANATIEDSYFHDPVPCDAGVTTPYSQVDVSFGEDVTVRHNHIDRGHADACTAASALEVIQPVRVAVENNLVSGGTRRCIYMNNYITNLRVIGNHFSTKDYPTCAAAGVARTAFEFSATNVWMDNVWHETGAAVPAPTGAADPRL